MALLLDDVRGDDGLGAGDVGGLDELAVVLHAALKELRDGLFHDTALLGLGGTGIDGLEIFLVAEGGEFIQGHHVERGAGERAPGAVTDLGDLREAVCEVRGHIGWLAGEHYRFAALYHNAVQCGTHAEITRSYLRGQLALFVRSDECH